MEMKGKDTNVSEITKLLKDYARKIEGIHGLKHNGYSCFPCNEER
jgi:hypothetical protein